MIPTIRVRDLALPALGLGTYRLTPEETEVSVAAALEAGYRHIDTAQMYRNEDAVGRALRASGVARDEVVLTTKITPENCAPADVHRSIGESLDRLGVDQVDLLLIHWPAPHVAPVEDTIEALAQVQERGLARHIGVSNFPAPLLRRAFEIAPTIVTNQVEHHPYLSVHAIRDVLAEHGAFVTAYCPLARGRLLDDPVLAEIAAEVGATTAQVSLRWLIDQGDTAVIPSSRLPERIRSNMQLDIELSDEQRQRIDALERRGRLVNPATAPDWDVS